MQPDGTKIQLVDGERSLSRSQSFEDSKKFFTRLVVTAKYSEKSAKMTVIKAAFDAHVSAEQIRDLGRWKTTATLLHHLEQSADSKK